MYILQTHIVPSGVSNQRLNDYACIIFFASIPSRKGIKKAIKRGEIRIDGAVVETGAWVAPGQKIELLDLELNAPKSYNIPLQIVFEDDDLAVVNKPAGLVVSGNQFRTLENALSNHLKPSQLPGALKWPKPVHRLDSPTSGLVLIAKTNAARIHLGQQFEHKTIKKRYRAIVMGQPAEKGIIKELINGKLAETQYQKVEVVRSLKNGWLSLLDLFPLTGRTHQLRIHLSNAGFPILGDQLYGKEGLVLKGKGLFLCAVQLDFKHPRSQIIKSFTIAEPAKFDSILRREQKRWEKYHG